MGLNMEKENLIRPKFRWHGEPRSMKGGEFSVEQMREGLDKTDLSQRAKQLLYPDLDKMAECYQKVQNVKRRYFLAAMLVVLGLVFVVVGFYFNSGGDFAESNMSIIAALATIVFAAFVFVGALIDVARMLNSEITFWRNYVREVEKYLNGEDDD